MAMPGGSAAWPHTGPGAGKGSGGDGKGEAPATGWRAWEGESCGEGGGKGSGGGEPEEEEVFVDEGDEVWERLLPKGSRKGEGKLKPKPILNPPTPKGSIAAVLNKLPKQKAMPVQSVPQGWDADLSVV